MRESFLPLHNSDDLVYFDSAATTQTHKSVVETIEKYYNQNRTSVHRGDFPLSEKVSEQYNEARNSVAKLVGANPDNILFTQGSTHGLNMIAHWNRHVPCVIVSEAEHSANILPWLAQGRTAQNGGLVVIPVDNNTGEMDTSALKKAVSENPGALVSVICVSNVTGLPAAVANHVDLAHAYDCTVCMDLAQTISSHEVDFNELRVEWAVFSGHKMFGPTGVGVLYSRKDLDDLPPLYHGGGTIAGYNFNGNIEYYSGPSRHEAGTPNISGVLGLGVAAEWIYYTGYPAIQQQLQQVNTWLKQAGLFDIPELKLICPDKGLVTSNQCRNVYSFTSHIHPADISAFLGLDNIAVRVGKVCAHPIVEKHSNNGILRVSTHIYNNQQDCEKLVGSLCKAIQKLT